jgi:hypothetical protein
MVQGFSQLQRLLRDGGALTANDCCNSGIAKSARTVRTTIVKNPPTGLIRQRDPDHGSVGGRARSPPLLHASLANAMMPAFARVKFVERL